VRPIQLDRLLPELDVEGARLPAAEEAEPAEQHQARAA